MANSCLEAVSNLLRSFLGSCDCQTFCGLLAPYLLQNYFGNNRKSHVIKTHKTCWQGLAATKQKHNRNYTGPPLQMQGWESVKKGIHKFDKKTY